MSSTKTFVYNLYSCVFSMILFDLARALLITSFLIQLKVGKKIDFVRTGCIFCFTCIFRMEVRLLYLCFTKVEMILHVW